MRQVTKSKKIKILPYPEWLVKAGMSKGIDHDRQHLGIILAAGEMIKVRQVNAEYKENLNYIYSMIIKYSTIDKF